MNEVRAREYLETDKAFCRSVILLTGCLLHTLSSAMSRRGQKMLMWPGHCSQPIRGQSPGHVITLNQSENSVHVMLMWLGHCSQGRAGSSLYSCELPKHGAH